MQQPKKPAAGATSMPGSKPSDPKKAPQAQPAKKPVKTEAPKRKF